MKHAILIIAAGLLTACGSTNNSYSYTPPVDKTRFKADVNTYAAIYKTWGQEYGAKQTDQALKTLDRLESHVTGMVGRYGSAWRGSNMARFLIAKARGWTYSKRKDYDQAMVHFERALGRKYGINGDTVADAHWGRGLVLTSGKRFADAALAFDSAAQVAQNATMRAKYVDWARKTRAISGSLVPVVSN